MYVTIDLETLGSHPNSVVNQIAAVAWNPDVGKITAEFQLNVDIDDELRLGFKPTGSTVCWWLNQSEEARKSITNGQLKAKPTKEALQSLSLWFKQNNLQDALVWSNGPSFDSAILQTHYSRFGASVPWKFFFDRCFRTLMMLKEFNPKKVPREGVHHNALDDCLHQAKCIQLAMGKPWKP
jgi:hypothetical protein